MMSKENLYTEEEVKSLITKAFDDAFDYGHYDEQFVFVDGIKISNDADYWIEQNLNQNKDNSWNSKYKEYLGIAVSKASQKIKTMKTLEEIIEENIKYLTKGKEMAMSNGHEDVANQIQIGLNTLEGAIHKYKNQND